jgi:hypothetical protein
MGAGSACLAARYRIREREALIREAGEQLALRFSLEVGRAEDHGVRRGPGGGASARPASTLTPAGSGLNPGPCTCRGVGARGAQRSNLNTIPKRSSNRLLIAD